jgi:amino acid transporter
MWALGLSLFEIVVGKQPFEKMSSFQKMREILVWTPTIPLKPEISNDMEVLITSLYVCFLFIFIYIYILFFRLKRNLEERPRTYLEILEMPFIRDISENPSDEEKAFVTHILDNIPPLNEQ